jgi:hypothetical protein
MTRPGLCLQASFWTLTSITWLRESARPSGPHDLHRPCRATRNGGLPNAEICWRVFDPLQKALKPFNEPITNVAAKARESAVCPSSAEVLTPAPALRKREALLPAQNAVSRTNPAQ